MNILEKLQQDALAQEALQSMTEEERAIWNEFVRVNIAPLSTALEELTAAALTEDGAQKTDNR
jgi:hypothetical protein